MREDEHVCAVAAAKLVVSFPSDEDVLPRTSGENIVAVFSQKHDVPWNDSTRSDGWSQRERLFLDTAIDVDVADGQSRARSSLGRRDDYRAGDQTRSANAVLF